MPSDREQALDLSPVSRETELRLEIYAELLRRWQRVTNLVAAGTLEHVWTRHFADSAQLLPLAADARTWIDLGSGAGFPGLVIAIQLATTAGAHVELIESDGRKCAFLRAVIRETGAAATVTYGRIETALVNHAHAAVVTARAVAPLETLVEYTRPLLLEGTIGLFMKGRNVEAELTAAANLHSFQVEQVVSRTDPDARIMVVQRRFSP